MSQAPEIPIEREFLWALFDIAYRDGPVTIRIVGTHITYERVECGHRTFEGSLAKDIMPSIIEYAKYLRTHPV